MFRRHLFDDCSWLFDDCNILASTRSGGWFKARGRSNLEKRSCIIKIHTATWDSLVPPLSEMWRGPIRHPLHGPVVLVAPLPLMSANQVVALEVANDEKIRVENSAQLGSERDCITPWFDLLFNCTTSVPNKPSRYSWTSLRSSMERRYWTCSLSTWDLSNRDSSLWHQTSNEGFLSRPTFPTDDIAQLCGE